MSQESSLPATYTAAVIHKEKGELELTERPMLAPKSGEVLVKVLACGICRSDNFLKGGLFPLPRVPGHEIIGEVVALGPNPGRWKVGDRVGAGWHGGHCFHCSRCLAGDFVTCQNASINGMLTDGGYAEYATLRSESLASIPKTIDATEAAPLLCAGVTVFSSLRAMKTNPGDLVAVQGFGGLGHLAIQYAARMGLQVAVLSTSSSKKQAAQELGAHHYFDSSKVDQGEELAKLGGAKVVICTAPSSKIIQKIIPGIAVNGTVLLLAIPDEPIEISAFPLILKRIAVQGWPIGSPKDSEETVAFTHAQGIKCMVETFPLKDVNNAFGHMMSGKANFRAVLVP